MPNRPKPYTLSGDATAEVVDRINEMFDTLFSDTASAAAHNILSTTHADSVAATVIQGDLLVGTVTGGGTYWARLGVGAANTILRSAGTVPAWSQVVLSTDVTGTLPVANGGTGDATLTAYAVLCGGTTSTGAIQSIASVGTSGYALTSNGAGALPTFQVIHTYEPMTNGNAAAPDLVYSGTGDVIMIQVT